MNDAAGLPMRIIVGLGNPGEQYDRTRHNLGRRVVTALAEDLKTTPFRLQQKSNSLVREVRGLETPNPLWLLLPQTMMNASGEAVEKIVRWSETRTEQLLVVHDDKDLAFGTIKLQHNRSAAGHKGVQSIIDTLGSQDFWRLRLGVGTPPENIDTDEYVLQRFTNEEEERLEKEIIPEAVGVLREHL